MPKCLSKWKKKKEKCNTAFQVHTTNTDGHRLRKRKQSAQLHGPYQMTSCNCHNLCKISWDISAYHMKQMILLHSGSPHLQLLLSAFCKLEKAMLIGMLHAHKAFFFKLARMGHMSQGVCHQTQFKAGSQMWPWDCNSQGQRFCNVCKVKCMYCLGKTILLNAVNSFSSQ